MILIGVDPGVSGGIAWLDSAQESSSGAVRMPATDRDVLDQLDDIKRWAPVNAPLHAILEHVKAMPQDGRSSLFKFGMNFGSLRMALTALEIPYTLVTPAQWCGKLGLKRQKGESGTAWKNRHKALAQQHFPGLRITHATADALLLAHYGRMLK